MFAVNLRRIFYTCDKVVIRNVRGGKRLDVGPNPGLDKRLKAFQEDGFNLEDNDAEEFIEQSDSSFFKVGESYSQHIEDTFKSKRDMRHHIIKNKYFKEDMPNLLTWSEKEQIRHLASEHPNDWTPERIAESFPVTVAVVKKLIKFPWKPANEERIQRHDASAMRNWRELKEGTLDIPKKLQEHFMKFSDRSIPPLNRKSIKDDLTQEEKLGEFARIIQRCAKKSETKYEQTHIEETCEADAENKLNIKRDSKRTTLDQLTSKIKKRLDSGAAVNLPDKIIADTVSENHTEIVKHFNKQVDLFNDKDHNENTAELTEYKESDNKLFAGNNYPQRIRIPRKAFKKGATYKVNDCFYDDDGRFLYRVIGMTKN